MEVMRRKRSKPDHIHRSLQRGSFGIIKAKKMKMHLDTKTGALIIAAVAILVIIFVVAFAFKSNKPASNTGPGANVPVTPVYAPQGQVVAGFPTELILDNAA